MCFRTLKHPRDPRWKEVKRIVTYSDGKMIRDVKIIDPEDNKNVIDPHIASRHYMTHFPKDPRCPVCNNCKIQKRPRRRKKASTIDICFLERT